MNKDNKLMLEAIDKTNMYDKIAESRSKVHLAKTALKACYEHFSSEPTDPGHPLLLKITKQALDEIGKI